MSDMKYDSHSIAQRFAYAICIAVTSIVVLVRRFWGQICEGHTPPRRCYALGILLGIVLTAGQHTQRLAHIFNLMRWR